MEAQNQPTPTASGAATIYDVAKKAGVSISTVSRVLNNNPNVLHETRQRVLKVIRELNFKPNPIARGLVVRQTNALEVFLSWPGYNLDFSNSWYMALLSGVNDVARENHYGLFINTVAGDFDPHEIYEKAFYSIVDGVLLAAPLVPPDELVAKLRTETLPFVLCSYQVDDPGIDWVDCDNVEGARQMALHLTGLGYSRIAMIAGPAAVSTNAKQRLEGFQKGMQEAGRELSDVVYSDFTEEGGFAAMKKLLAASKRPEAVFCANDSMAFGAVRACREEGLRVGEDIAITGFDNLKESEWEQYQLTTVEQDVRAVSREATKLLVEKIRSDRRFWKPRHILTPVRLVIRNSCGAGRRKSSGQ